MLMKKILTLKELIGFFYEGIRGGKDQKNLYGKVHHLR